MCSNDVIGERNYIKIIGAPAKRDKGDERHPLSAKWRIKKEIGTGAIPLSHTEIRTLQPPEPGSQLNEGH
jgi:hypothetical protein